MDEVEYVVPPKNNLTGGSTGGSNNSNSPQMPDSKGPQKPNQGSKITSWVKNNASLAIAFLAIIVVASSIGGIAIVGKFAGIGPMKNLAGNVINIEGDLSDGKVNVEYSQALKLSGNAIGPCTWSLDGISPDMAGSKMSMSRVDNVVEDTTTGLTSEFVGTPSAPGAYVVTISAECSDGEKTTQEFKWNVNPTKLPPVSVFQLEGNLPGGTPAKEFSTTISTSNAPSTNCVWSIGGIAPELRGATLTKVESLADTGESSAEFRVTPDAPGTYVVTITSDCSDEQGTKQKATQNFNLVVSLDGGGTNADNGTYVRFEGNPILIYRIENNTKRPLPFPMEEVMACLNAKVEDIKDGTPAQKLLPDGAPVYCNPVSAVANVEGKLLSGFPDSDRTSVYKVEKNSSGVLQRRPFPTQEIFLCLGYKWPDVHIANQKDLNLPLGPAMSCGNGTRELGIDGTFSDGRVNSAYSTTLSAINYGTQTCTFSLERVNPAMPGATLAELNPQTLNKINFVATPSAAGDYVVTVKMTCSTSTNGVKNIVTKDFNWKVTSGSSGGGGGGGGSGGGSGTACTNSSTIDQLTAVYRWWGPNAGDHMYTTNANEKPSGYRYEGISGYVFKTQVNGTKPIYRSSNSAIGAHYYTTAVEDPTKYGYKAEGIIGYAYDTQVSGSAPWYRLHNGGAASDYLQTTSAQEKSAVVELGYVDEGIAAYLCGTPQATELQPLFRLWGANDKDHFYTTNFEERDNLIARGYKSEGVAGFIYGTRKDGTTPLYRSYSRAIGDHLYTTSESEARSAGYTYEGIMGFIAINNDAKTTALYRLYSSAMGDHFYTSDANEANTAASNGYIREGTTGYVYLP